MGFGLLYRADNGNLIASVGLGDGPRSRSWQEEVSQMLMEGAVSPGLGAAGPLLGYGREANYPSWLNGDLLSSNPIGQAPVIPAYIGTAIFRAVACGFRLGLGDGAATIFGSTAPTNAALGHASYGSTGAADLLVPGPGGATAAARATTAGAGANHNLVAGAAIAFSLIVNGVTYAITGAAGNIAAVTPQEVVDAVNSSLPPSGGAYAMIAASGAARILTKSLGAWNTLNVVAGAHANILFAASSALGATVTGAGGPINTTARFATGEKPQYRVLPQTVVVTATVAANAITVTDNGLGVLAGNNGLGQTAVGTINYVTGAIAVTFSAAAVNGTPVNVRFKSLYPLDLTQPPRTPRSGIELALRLR